MKPVVRAVRRRRDQAAKTAVAGGRPASPFVIPRVPSEPGELAETTERLLVAFELLDRGIFDWDVASGVVRYFAPGHPATGPVPTVKLTSEGDWFRTTHPDDMALASAAVDRALRGETERFSTFYRTLFGGEWRWVRTLGRVVARGADGRAVRVVGTYTDATLPVTAEKGRHAREESARKAQVRAALAEVVSSLAHELNQPLAALSANVQAALRLLAPGRRVEAEAREALLRSVALAERAADVVRAMRQLVRPESGTDEPFDLAALARDACDLLETEARAADVVLRVASPRAPVIVTAARRQIELVLMNLVRNAIEAIAGTKRLRRLVTVRVRCRRGAARVEVEDTGPGVEPGLVEKIFEPYFTTKPRGTGLGLRLCRSFAEAHGGRLVCAPARPRKGALFILAIPAARPASDGPVRPARKARVPRG